MVVKKSLHIASWNINGFKCKGFNKYSDPSFINELKNKEIICLLETHCSLEDSLCLHGFKSLHLIRPKSKGSNKRSGGISIYVKEEIRHGIKFLNHQNNDYIWLKLCKDFFHVAKDIYLCFIYNPPSCSTYTQSLDEDILELIETDITKYSEIGNIILAGDFNARTGNDEHDFIENDDVHVDIPVFDGYSPDIDIPVRYSMDKTILTRGRALNDICIQSSLRILNGRTMGDFVGHFTCHTPRGSSVVDYMVVSENLIKQVSFFNVHNFLADLSDHCQISLMLKVNCIVTENENFQNALPQSYKWVDNSAILFQNTLSSPVFSEKICNFIDNNFSGNTDLMVSELNSIICDAADQCIKKKGFFKRCNKSNKAFKLNKPKWCDISLSKLRKQLYEKEKHFKKNCRDPVVRNSFYSHLKLYRKTRKFKIKEYRKNMIDQLDNLRDNNPKKYWSLLNELANSNNSTVSEISDKEWFEYFKKLNKGFESPNVIIDMLKEKEKEKIFSELDYTITNKEILDAICSLKNNKSGGFDIIINEMLKCSQIYFVNCFNKLFNAVLSTGNFPKLWAKGFIVPLFKNGSKDDPLNYRGITIGCCVGKLFTKILNQRLENFFTKRNLIKKEQIGFCKNKRTTDHLFVLKTLVDKYTQQGSKHLFTCLVDFRKAFDTVGHNELFLKLRLNGVSDLFYNVLKNMYDKTELCVKIDSNHTTDFFPSDIGVRQGDNLSPNLFKLFINDLPEIFDDSCVPVSLNNTNINCLMYADDVILLSENAQGLQNCLNKLKTYCDYWGLQVNNNKTKSLVFNNTGRMSTAKFTFDKSPIEGVRKYSYLGVTFSISGSFSDAKSEFYKKGLKAYFKLRKCFEGNKPKIKTLLHVFDHTVKPVLLYGSEIWGYFPGKKLSLNTDSFFDKLCKNLIVENVHKKFCKFLLEVTKRASNLAVMAELGRYPLLIDIFINMVKYYIRLLNSDGLLSEALSTSRLLFKNNKNSWFGCVYALLKYLDIDLTHLLKSKLNVKRYLLSRLKQKYDVLWHQELFNDNFKLQHGNKLRTYRLFKNTFKFEPYLEWGNYNQRKLITKFRISAHNLEIERGRYIGLKVSDRKCKLCKVDIEDECHFLLKCPNLEKYRSEILNYISIKYKNFNSLDANNKFVWLMSSEDNVVFEYIYKLLFNLNDAKHSILGDVS